VAVRREAAAPIRRHVSTEGARSPLHHEERLLLRQQVLDLLLKVGVLLDDAVPNAALHGRLDLALAGDGRLVESAQRARTGSSRSVHARERCSEAQRVLMRTRSALSEHRAWPRWRREGPQTSLPIGNSLGTGAQGDLQVISSVSGTGDERTRGAMGARRAGRTGRYVSAVFVLAALSIAHGRSIYCGDERYCDDDQTCCRSGDAGTHFFCCQARGATCCSDMQSCCPPDFPVCDLQAGGCVSKRSDLVHSGDGHGRRFKHAE